MEAWGRGKTDPRKAGLRRGAGVGSRQRKRRGS